MAELTVIELTRKLMELPPKAKLGLAINYLSADEEVILFVEVDGDRRKIWNQEPIMVSKQL